MTDSDEEPVDREPPKPVVTVTRDGVYVIAILMGALLGSIPVYLAIADYNQHNFGVADYGPSTTVPGVALDIFWTIFFSVPMAVMTVVTAFVIAIVAMVALAGAWFVLEFIGGLFRMVPFVGERNVDWIEERWRRLEDGLDFGITVLERGKKADIEVTAILLFLASSGFVGSFVWGLLNRVF